MNNTYTLTAAALAVLLLAGWLARQGEPVQDQGDEATQEVGTWESLIVAMSPSTYTPSTGDVDEQRNISAFLDMLAFCEGTAGPDGYRTMFGGRLFDSYADHPRMRFSYTNLAGLSITTSAAGRYQFIVRTWDSLRAKLGLQDFSPPSQDAGAIELIRQRGALNDVRAGRFAQAIEKCRPVWASLPGAGVDQPEKSMAQAMAAYANAGGSFA